MIVVNRFEVPLADADAFRDRLEQVRELLADKPGHLDGRVGRNLDDPTLWTLVTRWENVGAYRRALSSYDVKVGAVPLLSTAVDEPSAYELLEPGVGLDKLDRRTTDLDSRTTDLDRRTSGGGRSLG